jgi:hypothetical protein
VLGDPLPVQDRGDVQKWLTEQGVPQSATR